MRKSGEFGSLLFGVAGGVGVPVGPSGPLGGVGRAGRVIGVRRVRDGPLG